MLMELRQKLVFSAQYSYGLVGSFFWDTRPVLIPTSSFKPEHTTVMHFLVPLEKTSLVIQYLFKKQNNTISWSVWSSENEF